MFAELCRKVKARCDGAVWVSGHTCGRGVFCMSRQPPFPTSSSSSTSSGLRTPGRCYTTAWCPTWTASYLDLTGRAQILKSIWSISPNISFHYNTNDSKCHSQPFPLTACVPHVHIDNLAPCKCISYFHTRQITATTGAKVERPDSG